jgi:hypothetical protein
MQNSARFLVAAAIVLACLVGSAIYLVPRLADADDRMTRVAAPSIAQFGLDRRGVYTIYRENKAMLEGVYYGSDSAAGLKLVLTSLATGAEVQLVQPGIGAALSTGDRQGTPIYAFAIEQPGRYRLAASLPGVSSGPQMVLAIGYDRVGSLLDTTAGTIAVILFGAGVGGAVVLAARWRRASVVARRAPTNTRRAGNSSSGS